MLSLKCKLWPREELGVVNLSNITAYYEYILQISFYEKNLFWIPVYEEKILLWTTEVQEPFVQSVPMRK
jgi:hypothetical protein